MSRYYGDSEANLRSLTKHLVSMPIVFAPTFIQDEIDFSIRIDKGRGVKLAMGNTVVLYAIYTPSYDNSYAKTVNSPELKGPRETPFISIETDGGILVDAEASVSDVVNKIVEYKNINKKAGCIVHLKTGPNLGFFRIEETSEVMLMVLNAA